MSGCGTGSCGCGPRKQRRQQPPASTLTPTQTAAYEALVATMADAPVQVGCAQQSGPGRSPARSMPLNTTSEWLDEGIPCQRALHRIVAPGGQQAGLLSADDARALVLSSAGSIERHRAVARPRAEHPRTIRRGLPPLPRGPSCRCTRGERAHLRHVLLP